MDGRRPRARQGGEAAVDAADVRTLPTPCGRMRLLRWPGEPSAPTILFAHSLGQAAECWEGVARALAPSHRVYALDLPGHGSSDPPADASPDAFAAMLAPSLEAVADEAQEPPHLVAHAYAAPVLALSLDRLPPGFGRSLTLVAPLGVVAPAPGLIPTLPWPQAVAARVLARSPERVRQAVEPLVFRPEALPAAAWRSLSRSLARAEALWRFGPALLASVPPLLPALAALGRSARFVWCERDPVFPVADGERAVADAAAAGPRHHQARLAACGHLPMLEAPGALASLLARRS